MSKSLYEIEKDGDKYKVMEKASENRLRHFYNYKDAQNMIRFLKQGFGFNGFTPSFILIDTKRK